MGPYLFYIGMSSANQILFCFFRKKINSKQMCCFYQLVVYSRNLLYSTYFFMIQSQIIELNKSVKNLIKSL